MKVIKNKKKNKKTYKFFLMEKIFFFTFLKKTRLTYYHNPTTLLKNFTTLKTTKQIGVYNIILTTIALKQMFKQIMQITRFHGLIIIGGMGKEFINMGKKLFYTFNKWHCGFITNFIKLMRHTLIYGKLKKNKKKLLPLRNVQLKKTRQLPSYNISLKFQHYQLNEGSKLKMPQITTINSNQKPNINSTKILTINEQNVTKILLIFFIKESILETKKKVIKILIKGKKKYPLPKTIINLIKKMEKEERRKEKLRKEKMRKEKLRKKEKRKIEKGKNEKRKIKKKPLLKKKEKKKKKKVHKK